MILKELKLNKSLSPAKEGRSPNLTRRPSLVAPSGRRHRSRCSAKSDQETIVLSGKYHFWIFPTPVYKFSEMFNWFLKMSQRYQTKRGYSGQFQESLNIIKLSWQFYNIVKWFICWMQNNLFFFIKHFLFNCECGYFFLQFPFK